MVVCTDALTMSRAMKLLSLLIRHHSVHVIVGSFMSMVR